MWKSIEDAYNQISILKQYKDFTDKEKWTEARIRFKIDEMDLHGLVTTHDDRKVAKTLAYNYLKVFNPENISEINLLRELIYYEVIQQRLTEKQNKIYKTDKAVPISMIDSMHKNTNMILSLKDKLGLTRDKKQEESTLDVWTKWKKRVKKWLEENQGSRTLICPHCHKMVMLKIRPEVWDAQKHPFFKDKVLTNDHLVSLYKEGKVTKEDVAKILNCSLDYITDWLIPKWYPERLDKMKDDKGTPV